MAAPILNRDDVHVWRVPLDASRDVVADLADLLSDEETARVERMLCEEAVRRFVVSHGALRKILGHYVNERPEQLRLVTNAQGKPHLASTDGAPTVRFSLSHSSEFALCAVTKGRVVGVDIEQIRPISAWRQITERYFSRQEREVLQDVSPDRALEAFFQGWTRKEAYSKALGEGVSRRWTQFTVSLTPGAVVELPGAGTKAENGDRFTLRPLEPGAGYVAAVAAQGTGWHLRCWHWSWAEDGAARTGNAPTD
ncbi:MAG: 4'-phosphopantetheinyl transferase family protein [Anaerolineae bacterium]